MKYVIEYQVSGYKARFTEGPMQGKYAGVDYGLTTEHDSIWPTKEDLRSDMTFRGHEEWKFDAHGWLKKKTTRELMTIRDKCYKFGWSGYDITDNGGNSSCWVSMDQVLDELATREHIPNKQEAKVIRKQRAHEQRHR